MKIAIVESGGKQYRAVEGSTIDVDRLAREVGEKFDFERVLLVSDEDNVMVGTPTVSGVKVSASVVDHVKGPKVTSFKYRPTSFWKELPQPKISFALTSSVRIIF